MTTELHCARCGRKHPWPECWPNSTYATCWKCHVDELQDSHRATVEFLSGLLLAAALFIVFLAWQVPR